ncbi:thiamine phosphate synthase [Flavobacterium sp. H122]|uniref:thiamine phosphate synthase n=1 Tax=Flavobacterium sp. H122 TaxID=2529860 RepID=UPI0010A9E381|nr:thiamine phosphate synthase [Flavobacterium sp. H122]
MIVITNPTAVVNEINILHSLFENGLELLHIRKPDYSETEMVSLLTAVGSDFSNRLVLHSYHHLGDSFGINRFHFQKKERNCDLRVHNPALQSTSTHSIEEFNALENFEYAFLSPVYPSISKIGYIPTEKFLETVKKRTNFSTKLVALGGVSEKNIQQALTAGFDDVALLGTIWNSTNPLENFKKCQQIVHSF